MYYLFFLFFLSGKKNFPIKVTDDGNVSYANDEHSAKALFSIEVTDYGIVIWVIMFFYSKEVIMLFSSINEYIFDITKNMDLILFLNADESICDN